MRNCMKMALVAVISTFALGCSETKTEPKPPANTDLKPLASPKSPGEGAAPKAAGAPGGGASSQ